MIVEIRTYRVKKGQLRRFLDFFEQEALPLQRELGMRVLGPFVDLEAPDTFVWLRAFPSLEERARMKRALYEGEKWRNELEGIAMPMLDGFTVVLTEAPRGFACDPLANPTPPEPRGRT